MTVSVKLGSLTRKEIAIIKSIIATWGFSEGDLARALNELPCRVSVEEYSKGEEEYLHIPETSYKTYINGKQISFKINRRDFSGGAIYTIFRLIPEDEVKLNQFCGQIGQ